MSDQVRRRTVLLDHDGGVDDVLALTMLLAMPHIELAGVVVTEGLCYLRPAVSFTRKLLRLGGCSQVEVASGTLPGVNPFPDAWRATSGPIDALPILNESDDRLPALSTEPGHQFLARQLRAADAPLTVLVTGPVTNLAAALVAEPGLAHKIDEVVWMGGAVGVAGNVEAEGHDGSAEWNAYWDPPSTHRLWQSGVPITLVPLDATNQVPFGGDFLLRLARQRRFRLSDLMGQCLALTVGRDPIEQHSWFMWDALAAGYLGAPHLIGFRQVHTQAIPDGPSAGRITEADASGSLIRAADTVDREAFLEYVLGLLRT